MEFTPSRGQATLRRILWGDFTPDRTVTPVTFGATDTRMASVSTREVSPVQDFLFSESTREETRPSHQLTENSEGRRIPEGIGDGDTGSRTFFSREYSVPRSSEPDMRATVQSEENLQGRDANCLPGGFRYIIPDHLLAQVNATESSYSPKLSLPREMGRADLSAMECNVP